MMIANPTAASAAATVITKNTNTWPPTPYTWEKATKVRFTALSISSTHMNTMIAFRRVNTPTTPIVNSTAEKNRASANIGHRSPSAQHHRAHNRREQQHARDLEGEKVFVEEWAGDRRNDACRLDLPREIASRNARLYVNTREREDLCKDCNADRTSDELPPASARVGDLTRVTQVEQHDDEQEHHHDRAGVHQHLNRADELRVEHDKERGEREHRRHEPHRCRDGTLTRHEQQRRHDGDDAEDVEVEGVEKGQGLLHHSPLGSAGSHISHTGCVCAISRSRSYTKPSRLYSEFS